MVKVRLYVDSVWDSDIVVLISTDGKTETAIKFEKDALAKLLEGRRGFFKAFKIRRGGVIIEGIKLKRKIEGKAALFPTSDKDFFKKLVEDFKRPPKCVDESMVKIVKKIHITLNKP